MKIVFFCYETGFELKPPEHEPEGLLIQVTPYFAVGLGYHTLTCRRRWWAIRLGSPRLRWHKQRPRRHCLRLGYMTRGEMAPNDPRYASGGFWWPWQFCRSYLGSRPI